MYGSSLTHYVLFAILKSAMIDLLLKFQSILGIN